jgi:glycosyltransferase involved in cell wall biosynthesis
MKVLIYFDKNDLAPKGGPSGYLLNVYNQKVLRNDDEIEFLDEKNSRIKKFNWIKKLVFNFNNYLFIKRIYYMHDNIPRKDFNNYDIIHFHRPIDLFIQEKNLKEYKGIVLLTSHSPKVFYKELLEDVATKYELLFFRNKFKKMELIDEFSFRYADYILFPCKDAEEPYYNSWNKYSYIRKEEKMLYCPTGIDGVPIKQSRKDVRKKYKIAEDKIVISYVGRHNEVKGYDILKKLGNLLDENKYVFICCGNEYPLTGLDKKNWIEVGWTDDPYSIVNASDIYILPNKETYFDIALLQTLSIGKLSIISNTGGNKYFIGHENDGIYLYDNLDQLIQLISDLSKISLIKRKDIENKQKNFFMTNFTSEIYYDNYKKILCELIERRRA